MPRYIDADKAMDEINRIGGHNLCEWETIGVKALIDRQPTADVVEVVRCKDCRYWEEIGFDPITEYTFGYCRHYQWQDEENSRETNGQDYCSYGRREE